MHWRVVISNLLVIMTSWRGPAGLPGGGGNDSWLSDHFQEEEGRREDLEDLAERSSRPRQCPVGTIRSDPPRTWWYFYLSRTWHLFFASCIVGLILKPATAIVLQYNLLQERKFGELFCQSTSYRVIHKARRKLMELWMDPTQIQADTHLFITGCYLWN